MDNFYEHISRKATNGIRYKEAVQLMLWMFLTLGYIPKEFQELELNKASLAILFSKLRGNGKTIAGQADNVCVDEIARPEPWGNVMEKLLQRTMTLDETFPQRVGSYV